MTQRVPRIAATVVFIAATIGAALTDGLTHTSTRSWTTAVVEGLTALMLGAGAVLSAGRGARLFGLAMLVLACGIVATSGVQPDGSLMILVTLFGVSVLLTAAFLRSAGGAQTGRGTAVPVIVSLVVLAGLLTVVAVNSARSLDSTRCGTDNCAFSGLGIVLALSAAFEVMLLTALVAALAADRRAGAGILLFAAGLNLILAVAPTWSQYQGVMGVAVGYTGLGLAVLPWFMPRRAKWVNVPTPAPEPTL
jgi:hypothetical protein